MKTILVLAIVAALAFGFHALQADEDGMPQNIADGFNAIHAQAAAQNDSLERNNDRMERAIEKNEWNSPQDLR